MNQFLVDVLTPEKVVAKDIPGESLLIPTEKGQINVLPSHTHLITRLGTGIVTVFGSADDPDKEFSVTHGICKVLDNKVTIMTHTSEEKGDIDVERAKRALDRANDELNNNTQLSDEEIVKFRRKAERAALRIQLSKR